MTWERARNENQKQFRVNEIIEATARLYSLDNYEEITFAMISKEANFTRSNLYKYFNNKEEIFLELLISDMTNWRKDILKTIENNESIDDICTGWIKSLLKHKRMINLYVILYTFLEKNSSLESLSDFKKRTLKEFSLIIKTLIHKFPKMNEMKAMSLLFAQLSLTIGSYPMFNLTDKQKKAMKNSNMPAENNFYKEIYENSIRILFKGIIEE